ncbi:MAG TPA: RagB/SusD family nutrient uptake outer membrane protein, partial [Chitinophagaceae bacterium]|nr:RagB/SusD family nutrient uptake outer membrane protein [Chitinophagaceae bacterium]
LNLSETRSDNLYAVSEGGVRDWEGINSFHKTIASNPYVEEAWSSNFNGIYKANEVLEQLSEKGDEIFDNDNLKERLTAETKFLRAFYYFDLVRWFGEVPLIDHTVTAKEANAIPRSKVSKVYDLIISDLQFAKEHLPESYSGDNVGRATKYAAEGVLALVYMTRSGPAYGIKGPGLGLDEWNKALPLLNDIINGPFSFISSYKKLFSYGNENNSEVVFDVEYSTGSDPIVGGTFPWVLVPDAWFKSKGKNTQGGLQIRPISEDLLNSYEPGDVRKSFSIQQGYTTSDGVSDPRSFFVKYVDLSKVPDDRHDWPINYIVLRLTNVLLLKAECILNGASGSQGDVDNIVNEIRDRAGLPPISNVTLKELMEVRRKEFAGEGKRWHALVRSGLVVDKMKAWIQKDDVQDKISPFNKNYIIYPIPQSQLDVRAGLYTQNPGY